MIDSKSDDLIWDGYLAAAIKSMRESGAEARAISEILEILNKERR